MKFPSTDDFLQAFGIEPVVVDPGTAYCQYVKTASDGAAELEISFSAVSESFQTVLRCRGKELVRVCSEKVKCIELRQDASGSGIHVVFDIKGVTSEALISMEPDLGCHWWTIRDV